MIPTIVPTTDDAWWLYIFRLYSLRQLHEAASWLAQKMKEGGHAVVLLSEEITVEQRIAVLNRFREGKEKLLITTNVCARGIDVEQVWK